MTGAGTLAPECARLVARLRELKDRGGLSLAALAHKTAYSKSSWERYLNGKARPPRGAVEALCRLAGERPGPVLALWELADAAWNNRAATRPADAPGPSRPQQPGEVPAAPRGRRPPALAAGVIGGLVCSALAVGLAVTSRHAPATVPGPAPGCRAAACDGRSPASTFCDADSVPLALRRTASGADLEIRYSPRCGAAWARIGRTRVGDRVEVAVEPGGHTRGAEVADVYDTEGYLYTPMVAADGRHRVRGCLVPAASTAPECVAGDTTGRGSHGP